MSELSIIYPTMIFYLEFFCIRMEMAKLSKFQIMLELPLGPTIPSLFPATAVASVFIGDAGFEDDEVS